MKIRRIKIVGFRGARFALAIDFTANPKSLAVFGENASGKSTITDAIEWFINNRVPHLWREDCKEDSLRNVLLDAAEPSEVTIEFSDGATNTKRIDGTLFVSNTNRTSELQKLIESRRKDRITLRHAQITQFIQQPKSEKRKALASIIGYDAISGFRDVIQSTMNALQRDRQYTTAKQRLEEEKRNLLHLAGKLLTTPQMLYDQMNADLKEAGFALTVSDKQSFLKIDKELRAKVNQEERLETKLQLDNSLKDIAALTDAIATLQEKTASLEDYNALIGNRDRLSRIYLGNFLRSGVSIIDRGYVTDEACPFCLSDYQLAKLRSEVEVRLQAIVSLTEKFNAATATVEAFIAAAGCINSACDSLVAKYPKLDALKALCSTARQLMTDGSLAQAGLVAKLKNYESIAIPEKVRPQIFAINQSQAKRLREYVQNLIRSNLRSMRRKLLI